MALQQGRFTRRHDRALKVIYDLIVCNQPNCRVVCYLDGLRASNNPPSTITPDTISTSACPDIAIITPDCITLAELTSPWHSEDNLAQAKCRKNEKENYQLALSDLTNLGLSAKLITIEIGCLGHHLPKLLSALKSIIPSSTAAERTMLRYKLAQSVIASPSFKPTETLATWTGFPYITCQYHICLCLICCIPTVYFILTMCTLISLIR